MPLQHEERANLPNEQLPTIMQDNVVITVNPISSQPTLIMLYKKEYHIYLICAAPSNCAALQYYLKSFNFVSGNNFNCTAPSNSIVPYLL